MNINSDPNSNLSKTIVNKAAETAIATQVESAQNIEVNVESQASQIIQGQADSVEIVCDKIIAFEDISLEQLYLTSDHISLDLTQAILGNLSLKEPGNFAVKIIFTESDCDRLLNSEYVKLLLQKLTLEIEQQPANFYLQQAQCKLKNEGVICLASDLWLNLQTEIKTAKFQINFQLNQRGKTVKFQEGKYLGDQSLDFKETVAIMNKIQDLLYLRCFSNADLAVEITNIEIAAKRLILDLDIQIKRLPDSLNKSVESVASAINRQN